MMADGVTSNYQSYADNREGAEALLQMEAEAGWLMWHKTRQGLERACGKPVSLRKIGVIVKQKGDQRKLRLIHDLRRSGVNAKVATHERVVLPRANDARDDVLGLIETCGAQHWEMFVLDLKDAFKQIKLHPAEHKHLAGQAASKYFPYLCIVFGIKSGPLVWGRTAALLMRLTSAVMKDEPPCLECFVDDPLFTIGGNEIERVRLFSMVVILWLALGFRISWKKGSRGRKIEWIGIVIQEWLSATRVLGVTFTMSAERIEKLATTCKELAAEPGTVSRNKLRQLAGLATWIAGVLPQLTAYTAMLWAAIACAKKGRVETAHVRRPLRWLMQLCQSGFMPVQRHCRKRAESLQRYP